MGFKGAAIGGFAGWFVGGPLGSLLGSIVGSWIENQVKEESERAEEANRNRSRRQRSTPHYGRSSGGSNNGMIFCACAAAILAKIAKADGVVTPGEIAAVESAFRRLGFSQNARNYAINVFRKAKDDDHTVYEYAYNFASAVPSVEVRELLYELLWDVACADGRIGMEELAILRQIPLSLGIRPGWFELFARERIRDYGANYQRRQNRQYRQPPPPPRDSLADAYEMLGASPKDDDATLKRKYRELAKKYHPDALRAQGLPDEMIGKANEKMAKINAAWSEIKSARGL